MSEISRETAWNLLTEFTQSESLRKHALAVEACMRACSKRHGDGSSDAENLWGVIGLIHDFDYERWPSLEDHPYRGNEILEQRGYPEIIRRAIMRSGQNRGAIPGRVKRRIGNQREKEEERGDAHQESDQLVKASVPGGDKNRCQIIHLGQDHRRGEPQRRNRPERNYYAKKRRFRQ